MCNILVVATLILESLLRLAMQYFVKYVVGIQSKIWTSLHTLYLHALATYEANIVFCALMAGLHVLEHVMVWQKAC